MALRPRSQDALSNAHLRLQLAQILTKIGQGDDAVDQLASLLSVPGYISVPSLRVDHTWDQLRGNPRFQRLLERGR